MKREPRKCNPDSQEGNGGTRREFTRAELQASLALIAFVLGTIAWWQTATTNDVLLATDPIKANGKTRSLIVKWGRLHLVRTALGALGVQSFLTQCGHKRACSVLTADGSWGH
jgi:hypothetical protein